MIEKMAFTLIFVADQEEALTFYTEKLGFVKATDVSPVPGWRFITVAPHGGGVEIILHRPNAALQEEDEAARERGFIGQASPMLFRVDDCRRECEELRAKGVTIAMEPFAAPFGTQAQILDLYGNSLWLIEYPKREAGEGG
jgi:predicted enzyme related to lactoylglutathione lyase